MNKIYLLFITACCILLAFSVSCESKYPKTVFNLKDFGAIPDDGEDDSEAFNLALNKCRENSGSTLIIPPGSYNYRNAKGL